MLPSPCTSRFMKQNDGVIRLDRETIGLAARILPGHIRSTQTNKRYDIGPSLHVQFLKDKVVFLVQIQQSENLLKITGARPQLFKQA